MKNYIREERAKKQLTQAQLADLVHVSRQTIISIETNRYLPSAVLALKLAQALQKRAEDLFELEASD
ncbi:helix-turn-helix transcriptional regulator [Sabulibacter ruber]|uniref:helix-turn-helix transcriptional regulator n=1 Tax=Sabulibacter ruber TaxID=2811901 RepID=UPI001A95A4D2|nr:helix-turn-helix transcriptional regulator [Sabulibacter ruber]